VFAFPQNPRVVVLKVEKKALEPGGRSLHFRDFFSSSSSSSSSSYLGKSRRHGIEWLAIWNSSPGLKIFASV
jgi:hypothetical protein